MKIIKTDFEGLLIIEPTVYEDERGYFFESFRDDLFQQYHPGTKFVQENESLSSKHTLRGLHYQMPPYAQGKLIRVVQGEVLDIAVDLRETSPYFGKIFGLRLSAANKLQLYIPEGFAHGFLCLEENTIFQYKCTNYYHKNSERAIRWDDPTLAIPWEIENPVISPKDRSADSFEEAVKQGNIFRK